MIINGDNNPNALTNNDNFIDCICLNLMFNNMIAWSILF